MNAARVRARWALLFGNFVIGTGVLAPAGLINEIGSAFAVDVATAGSLIGYGAAVLCIEAPLLAFATNRVDRRVLLTAALVLYVLGHLLSAFAPSFGVLLAIRVSMVGGAAIFTPQAASAIALFIAPEHRAGSVAFIFLGWSVALAIGVQQARLIAADPNAASATVALNTSLLYAGQAIGTSLGGWALSSGHADRSGMVAVTLIVIALFVSIAAQRRFSA